MGDKFLSTLFKFRTKARSGARFFLRRDFVRLDFRFWATSRHRLKLSTQFFVACGYYLTLSCDTLTLFDGILTLSTGSPLNQPLSYSFTVASFLHDFRNVRTRYYQQFGIKHNQFQERRMVILLVWKQI